MTKHALLRSCASAALVSSVLVASAAHAQSVPPEPTVVDGNEGNGLVLTNAVPQSGSNANVINPTNAPTNVVINGVNVVVDGANVSVGDNGSQTILSNFKALGGEGSGGGAGLGGAFFIDDGQTLTLTNVTLRNNTAEGGTGGLGSVGGSMNGLVSPGTASTGQAGADSDPGFANFDGGKGGPGYAGFNGANATLGVGGTGGAGGNGSNGLAVTADTVLAALNVAYDAVQVAKDLKSGSDYTEIAAQMTALSVAAASGANAGGPTTAALAPLFAQLAVNFAELAASEINDTREEAIRLAGDTAYMIAMTVTAYQVGASGVGGDGGSGATGGSGSRFFSGGTGGAGGYGGYAVGTSGAVGGGGGSGGAGGTSGFGAGGASGGSGGAGGASGQYGGVSGDYLDGDAGEGGANGFGGGVGSNGDDLGGGGGGGSGFGGAIFVAKGGRLNIVGDALFADNYVLGGSSENGGEAGQAAGTDLFMMRGSTVTLSPGAGNTIRFEGSIADDSAASVDGASLRSGNGASIRIRDGGLVQFAGDNSYTGTTFIGGATLEADIGAGIHVDSRITFDGTGTIGGSGVSNTLSANTAGVLLTSGEIVRRVGTNLPNQINWTGSGGFAATDEGLVLNFGKTVSSAGQTLNWGSGGFVAAGSTLTFGSEFGTGSVTLENDVNLNGLTGRIAVFDNTASDVDRAVLTGKFTNGALEVNDAGYSGEIYFTDQSSLNALTVHGGFVSTSFDGAVGRLMDAENGGDLNIFGGSVEIHGDELLQELNVSSGASLKAFSSIVSGDIVNDGDVTVSGAAHTGNITNFGVLVFSDTLTADNVINAGTATFNSIVSGFIGNTGDLTVRGAADTGNINNRGVLTFADTLDAGSVANRGILTFGAASDIDELFTEEGTTLNVQGNLTAVGQITNLGEFVLEANVDTGAGFFNDGLLTVVGGTSARRITTTALEGEGTIDLGGLNGPASSTLDVEQSGDSIYAGPIVGLGSFIKSGTGTLNLTGTNTFAGSLSIAAGAIDTTGGGTFADTLDAIVESGARLLVGTADEVRSITNRGTLVADADLTVTSLNNIGSADMIGSFTARGNVLTPPAEHW